MKLKSILLSLCLIFTVLFLVPTQETKADNGESDVIINEIMYDPAGSDSGNEWIELYNNGTAAVNITNWVITDQDGDDDFVFPEMSFPANTFIVVHSGQGINDTDFSDDIAEMYMWKTSAFLENSGDDIILQNNTGGAVDYAAYDYGSYVDLCPIELSWDDMNGWVDDEGNSISLHPNGQDIDSGLSWEESDPTPGDVNAHLNDDPPSILEVIHSPLNPRTSESVTIIANVSDDYGLQSVELIYNINDAGTFSIPMIFDGQYYTVQIPEQVEGSVIQYHINVSDDAGQITTSSFFTYTYSDLPFKVLINEFVADPNSDWDNDGYSDYYDEWIELLNKGSTAVNLCDWRLDDKLDGGSTPYIIPFGIVIQPDEALVFYRSTTGIALDNSGDNVTLLNETGTQIDNYTYSSGSDDVAIGRYPSGAANWEDFLLPTPGTQNQYTVDSLENLSNIKINEFMPSPKTLCSTEWIELYNNGSMPVSLDGCMLDDILDGGKKPYQIPLHTTLQPGEFILFNRSFGLNNEGDSVNLLYIDGTVIDTYSYDSSEYDISFGRETDGDENWATYSKPTPGQANTPTLEPSNMERRIMISELFYKPSDSYEFLSLNNPSDAVIDISGWRISDGQYSYSGTIIFPEYTMIQSLENMYISNNAVLFQKIMGFTPDFEYGNSSVSVPDMICREEPGFANERDEVLLLDEFGHQIDIVVYGDSEYQNFGWNGTPIPDTKKGELLRRNFNDTIMSYDDTNTSIDWKHIRRFKVGQSDFGYDTFTFTGNITVFASPDSSFETVIREIESAQNMIYISMYQFTNWNITKKIIEMLNHGVEVKILMEGGPVGERLEGQKYVLQKIFENGGDVKFMIFNSTLGSRYRYIHAKYAVIDNSSVIISSENWKYTGIPVNNTFGNRGWGVVVRNDSIAKYFADVFFADWDFVEYDIYPFTPKDPEYGNASSEFELDDFIETGYYDPIFPSKTLEGEFSVSPVLSPDTSLLESDAILGMINSAVDTIYIEQLDMVINWNDGDVEYENLYLKAAIEAAEKRQVDVKILLSFLYAYPDDPELDNYDTYVYINDYASRHNITEYLEARLADYPRLELSKIHNKGVIVDGNKTLISSINWNRNSVTQNREVGVIIESEDIAGYFTQIFLWDWNEPPIADTDRGMSAFVSEPMQFNDLTFDSDGNLSYYWDFSDGTNSTQQNPSHTFKEEGFYDVRLTVTDGQYTDSVTITVIVNEAEEEGGETTIYLSAVLLLLFLAVIVVIIAFIRRMRRLFI